MSEQISQISSGFDSHSSSRSSPECLKHFPREYFYLAKMKQEHCAIVIIQNLLTKALAASWIGKNPSILLGHKMQETRVSLLHRSELKFRGRDHENLIYEKRARERLIHAFSRQTYAFAGTSENCHSIESIEIGLTSRSKAGPPHHVYQHRHRSFMVSKLQGPELC